jgi:hypothetical protein
MKNLLFILFLSGCATTTSKPLLLTDTGNELAKTHVIIDEKYRTPCSERLEAVMPDSPSKSDVLDVKAKDNLQYSECYLKSVGMAKIINNAFPLDSTKSKQ